MIYNGDLFDVLPTLQESSVDACVTDPPYELGFMGKAWDGTGVAYKTETWREVLRVMKPGGYLVAFGGTRTSHRMVCAIEDAGFQVRDSLCWLYGSGFPKSLNIGDGRGTALKPAFEPICLARKPLVGTVAANVQRFGAGALNIDASRIAFSDSEPYQIEDKCRPNSRVGASIVSHELAQLVVKSTSVSLGRWPANVLLDVEAAALLDAQAGELVSGGTPATRYADKFKNTFGTFKGGESESGIGRTTGGASRFYYVAKPSREERDFGCESLTSRQRDESRKEGHPGGDNPRNRGLQPRGNYHPTVKPVELMRWLVRLVTPTGGMVLDPFTGSGTTGMACRYELREFIGIERESEYVQIAERRIAAVAPLFTESAGA